MSAVNLKLDRLEAELQDLNSQESKDEASLAKVHLLPSLLHENDATDFCFICFSVARPSGEEADARHGGQGQGPGGGAG